MLTDLADLKELHWRRIQLGLQLPVCIINFNDLRIVPETLPIIGSKPDKGIAVLQIVVSLRIFSELYHLLHGRQRVYNGLAIIGIYLVKNLNELLV